MYSISMHQFSDINAELQAKGPRQFLESALPQTLSKHPHVLKQLEAAWGTPNWTLVMEQLLYDNRGGQRRGFTLPIWQELYGLKEYVRRFEPDSSRTKDPWEENGCA